MPLVLFAAGALALAVALGCGDDQIGVGDTLETEGGATYRVVKATVAETEDELYEALGQTPPTPTPSLPGTPQIQSPSYGPPSGVYVAVEVIDTGATDDSGDGEEARADGEGALVVLGGDGEEYTSGAFQIGFDIESISEGGEAGEEEFTTTGIYDMPTDATAGAQLQIEEAGTTYTIDLGL